MIFCKIRLLWCYRLIIYYQAVRSFLLVDGVWQVHDAKVNEKLPDRFMQNYIAFEFQI